MEFSKQYLSNPRHVLETSAPFALANILRRVTGTRQFSNRGRNPPADRAPTEAAPALHGCRNPSPSGKFSLSGIPGSYSSFGIHEPSSRLCCPGGSFESSQSAGCIFVPMPNTARPEGGCLTIHQSSSHPLPFWLIRSVREETRWHHHKYL